MPKIVIIGGGIAGCTTALKLAEQRYEVVIIEQKDDILQSTRANTPGRMGLGYHYFDKDTGIRYMRQTIEFMKRYPDCLIGDESTPHLTHGRYFILKDSLIKPQDLRAIYGDANKEFRKMCAKDSSNKIFGDEISNLHEYLHTKDYESGVNYELVDTAIETQERLLDWQKFSQKIKSEIQACPNIKIRKSTKVENVYNAREDGTFSVLTNNGQFDKTEEFDYVLNCSWQNIEAVNEQLHIGDAHIRKDNPTIATTSRLKLLVEVELPDSLKDKPSMFFCVGPHAMFTNLGNGKGRITYAPITNFGTTTESKMPEQFDRWLEEGLTEEEAANYGQKIIDGVAKYIPAMKYAKLLKVMPGIVKSKGSVDLEDKDSPFHKRNYSGVEEQRIGWIDNGAMKLFYCLGGAIESAEIITKQEIAKSKIKEIVNFVANDFCGDWERIKDHGSRSVGKTVFDHLNTNFKADDLTDDTVTTMRDQISNKSIMLKSITQLQDSSKNNTPSQ